MKNEMELWFTARGENESLARMAVASFLATGNPTIEEIADVKTAVSEAVTNGIIHGYHNGDDREQADEEKKIRLFCRMEGPDFTVIIEDEGCGIEDIPKAMEPMYTSRPDLERSGMGFSFMQTFMDELEVKSTPGKGTVIQMKKRIAGNLCTSEDAVWSQK